MALCCCFPGIFVISEGSEQRRHHAINAPPTIPQTQPPEDQYSTLPLKEQLALGDEGSSL